jgi:DNA-directed RNA polymerase specialized sigma24 family protein
MAKEVFILVARDAGASVTEIATIIDLDTSNVSRRFDEARQRLATDTKLAYAKEKVEKQWAKIAESQA